MTAKTTTLPLADAPKAAAAKKSTGAKPKKAPSTKPVATKPKGPSRAEAIDAARNLTKAQADAVLVIANAPKGILTSDSVGGGWVLVHWKTVQALISRKLAKKVKAGWKLTQLGCLVKRLIPS